MVKRDKKRPCKERGEEKHKAVHDHKAPNENERHEAKEKIKLWQEKDNKEILNQPKQL